MPKGYVIGRAKVTNATQWAAYAAKASEVIKHLWRHADRARRPDDGGAKARAAPATSSSSSRISNRPRPMLFSPEYAEARKLREGAGEIDLVVVEGA